MAPKPKKQKPSQKPEPKKESKKKMFYSGYCSRFWTWFFSLFRGGQPGTPVKGCAVRLSNIMSCHYRGILGFFVPLFALSWQGSKERYDITVQCAWIMMFWFFLLQPVSIPATSFVPLFLFPMTGVLSSEDACQCYANENIILFILTSMLLLCLNNSGYDRRLALWFLSSGDICQFGGKRMVFKCCTAGFFMSMLSNRLMAASTIIQYISKPLTDLQSATSRTSEPCYDTIRNIMISATSVSCAIGSTAIMHAAPTTLAFRTIFHESNTFPDIFNYLQYSAFAFPTAAVLNMANFIYHMFLISWETKHSMSISSMTRLRNAMLKYKKEMPLVMRRHELLSVVFVGFYLIIFFTRWCKWLNMGWADYSKYIYGGNENIPGCMDATTAAIFVIALHTFPKGFSFWHVLCEHKKSKVPPLKMESAILWWRFVDKNINYAYMFVIGSGVALTKASQVTELNLLINNNGLGKIISDRSYRGGLFLICMITVILANIMPGLAGLVIFLPFVAAVCTPKMPTTLDDEGTASPISPASDSKTGGAVGGAEFVKNYYLCSLAVGIASSFGFMCPFLYTPAYFCHYTGKVPKKKMAKYGFFAAVLCCFLLWLSLLHWAPHVWDDGVDRVEPPIDAVGSTKPSTVVTTTEAASSDAGGGDAGGGGADAPDG